MIVTTYVIFECPQLGIDKFANKSKLAMAAGIKKRFRPNQTEPKEPIPFNVDRLGERGKLRIRRDS